MRKEVFNIFDTQQLKTSVTYYGTGSQTNFDFPFDYLRKSFVHVTINDVEVSDYSIDSRTVIFDTAPSEGAIINIYRSTDTARLVSWSDASVLKASDMTIAQVQQLHILEEGQDWSKLNSLCLDKNDSKWQGNNHPIKNVSDPVDAKDVVTKGYMETVQDGFVMANTALKDEATKQAGIATKIATDLGLVDEAVTNAQNAATHAEVQAESVKKYKALWFDNVATMKAEPSLTAGAYVCTAGYYTANDGGGASYLIRAKADSDTVDNGGLHDLANGLVAELIIENGTVNVKQFGVVPNNATIDCCNILENICRKLKYKVYFPKGVYYFSETLLTNGDYVCILGDNKGLQHNTIFAPYNDGQAYVLKLGGTRDFSADDVNSYSKLLSYWTLDGVTFSRAGKSLDATKYGYAALLALDNAIFGKINVGATEFSDTFMFVRECWELVFETINITFQRNANLANPCILLASRILTGTTSNISNISCQLLNVESIISAIIRDEGNSGLNDFAINILQFENNRTGTVLLPSMLKEVKAATPLYMLPYPCSVNQFIANNIGTKIFTIDGTNYVEALAGEIAFLSWQSFFLIIQGNLINIKNQLPLSLASQATLYTQVIQTANQVYELKNGNSFNGCLKDVDSIVYVSGDAKNTLIPMFGVGYYVQDGNGYKYKVLGSTPECGYHTIKMYHSYNFKVIVTLKGTHNIYKPLFTILTYKDGVVSEITPPNITTDVNVYTKQIFTVENVEMDYFRIKFTSFGTIERFEIVDI